jgi:hypothetical protein
VKDRGEIAAAEDHALNPDRAVIDPEEDDVVSDDGESRFMTDIGAKLIVERDPCRFCRRLRGSHG